MLYTKNINITDTNTATVLDIPEGFVGHWNMLFISNLDGSTNDVTVFVDKDPDPDLYIFDGKNVNSKDYILFSQATVVLQPGDIIKASTGSAGNMEVIVTIDLVYALTAFTNFNGI